MGQKNYPGAVTIDLLEPDIYRQYKSFPERLREVVEGSNQSIFIIDEIQKAPSLLSLIHALIEEKKQWRFILTGSSARKLKREGADLKTYLALYMKEEVQMEGLVRNVEEFGQFLEIISFSQASILNYANIARDCHVSSKSVENYVSILEDLLLCFKLPVFTKKAKRLLAVKSKFYYFDTGVYRSIRPKGSLDYPEELNGIILETLVAQHLRAWLDYSNKEGKLYFWRTKNGLEVDFIVYGEIGFYAIEVKYATNIHPKDLRGLIEFKQDYLEVECLLLYQGKEVLKKKILFIIQSKNFYCRCVQIKICCENKKIEEFFWFVRKIIPAKVPQFFGFVKAE